MNGGKKMKKKPCVCYLLNFREREREFIHFMCIKSDSRRPTHLQGEIKEFLHPILFDRLFYLYRKERKEKITEYQFF